MEHIRHICLIFSEDYIRTHFEDIKAFGSVIEQRLDDSDLSMESLLEDNRRNLQECQKEGCQYILVDEVYEIDFDMESML